MKHYLGPLFALSFALYAESALAVPAGPELQAVVQLDAEGVPQGVLRNVSKQPLRAVAVREGWAASSQGRPMDLQPGQALTVSAQSIAEGQLASQACGANPREWGCPTLSVAFRLPDGSERVVSVPVSGPADAAAVERTAYAMLSARTAAATCRDAQQQTREPIPETCSAQAQRRHVLRVQAAAATGLRP